MPNFAEVRRANELTGRPETIEAPVGSMSIDPHRLSLEAAIKEITAMRQGPAFDLQPQPRSPRGWGESL